MIRQEPSRILADTAAEAVQSAEHKAPDLLRRADRGRRLFQPALDLGQADVRLPVKAVALDPLQRLLGKGIL